MQALSMDQLVGQVLGSYRLERFLGKGRLNAIYLARNLASQRLDALTMYLVPSHFSVEANARFLARFRKESASITKLDHPHILPIYEYGEYTGTPYLVTPYVTQGSLATLLKRHGRYDHTEIVPILEQLASGVAHAHSQGYIHGSLRPSNVVLRDQDTLQVAGFGLMYMLQLGGIEKSEQPYAHLLTVGRTFLASPEYIAPEVVQGGVIDARSDIYALGCILFELLCGQPPFTGSDPLEIVRLHVTQNIPSLRTRYPDIPIALVSVVNQALERDPARRFQCVEDLKEAFIQASRGASPKGARKGDHAEEMRNWLEQTQIPEHIQEMSPEGYGMSNTGKWQLLPPIVSGALPLPELPSTPTSDQREEQNQPTVVTQPPHQTDEAFPDSAVKSIPGVYEDKNELARSYSWWSQDGTENSEEQVKNAQPAQVPPTREPLVVASSDDWLSEPVASLDAGHDFGSRTKRGSEISRRGVVALLAATGVIAASATTAAALNLNYIEHLMRLNKQSPITYANSAGVNTQPTRPQQTPPPPHTGTVIGNTKQATNTATNFTIPASGNPGLLVRLPSGTFVAYDRACTHVGVLVNYDPVSQKFVCPAHGAVFDPANKGAVLKGPAQQPLPTIAIQVQADGTVTTV